MKDRIEKLDGRALERRRREPSISRRDEGIIDAGPLTLLTLAKLRHDEELDAFENALPHGFTLGLNLRKHDRWTLDRQDEHGASGPLWVASARLCEAVPHPRAEAPLQNLPNPPRLNPAHDNGLRDANHGGSAHTLLKHANRASLGASRLSRFVGLRPLLTTLVAAGVWLNPNIAIVRAKGWSRRSHRPLSVRDQDLVLRRHGSLGPLAHTRVRDPAHEDKEQKNPERISHRFSTRDHLEGSLHSPPRRRSAAVVSAP